MKTLNAMIAAGAVLALTACGGSEPAAEENEEMEVVMNTMNVDTEASSLMWKGMKTEDYFHTGTVQFSEGSAQFVDGNLASGTFVVDLSTMKVADEELPDDKKEMLKGHLMSPDYFNTAEHGSVNVTVGQVQEGKAPVTINIMGQSIEQNLPLNVSTADGSASISGKFDVDFSALERPGFQPQEDGQPHVQPVISFELDLKLK